MSSSGTFLGFTDEPIPANRTVDALTSKIGGLAVVYEGESLFLQCQTCRDENCRLVSQIYCPVDDLFHRTIYIFCCPSSSCHRTSKGWTVLRLQSSIKTAQTVKPDCKPSEIDWTSDGGDDWGDAAADDWSDAAAAVDWGQAAAGDLSATNVCTKKQSEELHSPCAISSVDIADLVGSIDGLTTTDSSDTQYDSYYVSVVDNDDSVAAMENLSKLEVKLVEELERRTDKTGKGSKSSASAGEQYERSNVAHGDRIFYKFTKTVSKNSKQIIRYNYGGSALSMRSLEQETVPHCSSCGAQRTFEMQLMPALAQSLAIGGQLAALDVGTVIVYTCSSSCWAGKPVLEHVIVQHDPDEHLLNKIKYS